MASQQPTRPWFRLPSVARPAPPPTPAAVPEAPPPQPRPTPIRPTFRPIAQPQTQPQPQPQPQPSAAPPTTTLPPPVSVQPPPQPPPQTVTAPPPSPPPPATTPKPAPPNPTPSSVPSSPRRQSIVPSTPSPIRNRDTSAARVATTPPPQPPPLQQLLEQPSPRTIKPMPVRTPPPQPTTSNHAPPPPSPLVLPPPQAIPDTRIPPEAEQKTVLVQNKFADTETRKLHHPPPPPPPGMRVITIAGENKGAFMELVRPQQRSISSPNYLNRGGNTSSGEERGGDGKRSGSVTAAPPSPMRAFANSNVQGVNNSIVYNSSCSHHDPGVHLSFSRKLEGGGPPPPTGLRHRSKEGPAGDNSSGHLSN